MTKRNAARKKYTAKSTSRRNVTGLVRYRSVLLIAVIAILLCGAGFFVYQYKKNSIRSLWVSTYVSQLMTWAKERHSHLKKLDNDSLTKTKQLALAKNETNQPIHFEFYTALPNMQAVASDTIDNTLQKTSSTEIKQVSHAKAETMKATHTSSSHTKPAQALAPIVDVDELERELSAEIKQAEYVVQLGIFRSVAAAEQYRGTLLSAGFNANIAKVSLAQKKFFRVQMGPYSKDQARVAQHQLQKKGINGILKSVG